MSVHFLLAAGLAACALPATAAEKGRPVRVYTNEDLERVSALRGQTGVLSVPAARPAAPDPAPAAARGRGEEYWRREAERLRDKLEPLRERAEELRARIAERRSRPHVLPYSDPQIRSAEKRLQALEARMRELAGAFEDRARREGALPGWIR